MLDIVEAGTKSSQEEHVATLDPVVRLHTTSSPSTDVRSSANVPATLTRRVTRPAADVRAANDGAPTLTKTDLAELIFEHVGLNKREATEIVEGFFDEITKELERGNVVKLTGFGNFQLRDKLSRLGRNPKTGESAAIPARRVVTFRASQKLKALVDGSPMLPAGSFFEDDAGH